MTESTNLKRDNSKEAFLERMKNAVSIPPNKKENVEDLPRWVKTALVFWVVEGESYNDAAARFNKTGKTLSSYAASPAAKQWLSALYAFTTDPVEMAKAILRGNAVGITLERLAFLDAAQRAGDYAAGDKIAKDLQEKLGIVAKKESSGPVQLKISMAGSTLAAVEIESEHEEVEEADFEVQEP